MSLKPLLDLIRKGEVGTTGPEGYDRMYGPAEARLGKHKLTAMNLDQVRTLQERMVASRSTAVGGYQFIRKTFDATRAAMHLPGTAVWTSDLQDEMATTLLQNRGLSRYLSGSMTREDFANSIAKEWASLPVVTPIQGATRKLKVGQSYYSGDGLNKAWHDPEDVLRALDAIKAVGPVTVPPDVEPPPVPLPAPSRAPSIQTVMLGVIIAIGGAIAAYFGLGK